MPVNTILRYMLATAVALTCLTAFGDDPATPPATGSAPPGVVATVNGESIPASELGDGGPMMLHQLIDFRLLDQEAQRQGMVVSDAELNAAKSDIEQQVAPKSLADAVKEHSMTMDQFTSQLRHQIILQKLAVGKLPQLPRMSHVREILVASPPGKKVGGDASAQAKIKTIQAKLKTGAKFEALAKQYSDDPASRSKGGDVGVVAENHPGWDQRFAQVAVSLKPGTVAPTAVKTEQGYCLIKSVSTYKDHSKDEDALYAPLVESFRMVWMRRAATALLGDLRSKAKIVSYLPGYSDVAPGAEAGRR